LLQAGADISVRSRAGQNALVIAAIFGTAELIKKNAWANSEGTTRLMTAVDRQSEQVGRLFIAHNADLTDVNRDGSYALELAQKINRKNDWAGLYD
jgi:ankyrin repeat protein